MTQYIASNIISGNSDPGLKDAIGKKVYAGHSPAHVLHNAENDEMEYTLTHINGRDYSLLFVAEDKDGNKHEPTPIILKKDSTYPGYVPFENLYEFVLACSNHTGFMKTFSPWILCSLPYSGETIPALVTGVCDDGVVLGGSEEIVRWEELLKRFSFGDGTPCGKIAEPD